MSVTINFSDTSRSDQEITTWLWEFGDGTTSTSENPSHTYAEDGIYQVRLTVTNEVGAEDSTIQNVLVTSEGSWQKIFDFRDAPSGWQQWEGSSLREAGKGFRGGGIFYYNLPSPRVITRIGVDLYRTPTVGFSTPIFAAALYSGSVNDPGFEGWDDVPSDAYEVLRSGSASGYLTYPQEFLDGSPGKSLFFPPDALAQGIFFFLFGAGNFAPPNEWGYGVDRYIARITLSGLGADPFADPLTVSFGYIDYGLVVFFEDFTTGETTPVAWEWDFGDSGTSSDQNPMHVYASPGTYTVRLTVTDDEAGEYFQEQDITVSGVGLWTSTFNFKTSQYDWEIPVVSGTPQGTWTNGVGFKYGSGSATLLLNAVLEMENVHFFITDVDIKGSYGEGTGAPWGGSSPLLSFRLYDSSGAATLFQKTSSQLPDSVSALDLHFDLSKEFAVSTGTPKLDLQVTRWTTGDFTIEEITLQGYGTKPAEFP